MNILIEILSRHKAVLVISSLLVLTSCHQEFTLLDTNKAIVGNGTLESSVNFPTPVKAVINGKVFTGTWDSTKLYETDMAKMHRLQGSRAYQEYLLGNSSHQLKHGRARLAAEDGTQMECDFYYRTQPDSGSCNLDQKILTIKF